MAELTAYQNAAYAKQYSDFVAEVARSAPALEDTVARYLYKLMAYKDEYEVARLLTKPEFEQQIAGHVGRGRIDLLQPASAAAAALRREEEDEAGPVVPDAACECWRR